MFNEIGGQGIEIVDWSDVMHKLEVLNGDNFAVLLDQFRRHLHTSSSTNRLVKLHIQV